ncbi:M16 family metallopeptidase, partial [Clostridium sp.]|uniref:M16 family metallopeptidase n=1 Tax=Clostridium sp. TaxID=1506 RepID=UPI00346399E2
LYSSIVTKPSFSEEGFQEEKQIIIQEAMEWKEDLEQYIEDELLYNCFKKRRIKDIIIGREEELKHITLEELKRFYNEHYIGENIVISFVTSKDRDEIIDMASKSFSHIKKGEKLKAIDFKEDIKEGTYERHIEGLKGSKILYAFNIGDLNEKELEALYMFNMFFGEGVSSILFSNIRTREGLAYEIKSNIKYEKGIGLFTIYGSTSKENVYRMKEIIDNIVLNIKNYINDIGDLEIYKKRLLMKLSVNEESSIRRALRLCVNDIMFNTDLHKKEIIKEVDIDYILGVVDKVFKKGAVQIFK